MRSAKLLRVLLLALAVGLWPGPARAETICESGGGQFTPVAVDNMVGLYRGGTYEIYISPCGIRIGVIGQYGYPTQSPGIATRREADGGFVAISSYHPTFVTDGVSEVWIKPGVPGTIQMATVDTTRPSGPRIVKEYTFTWVGSDDPLDYVEWGEQRDPFPHLRGNP
jgi:hypothetical protein